MRQFAPALICVLIPLFAHAQKFTVSGHLKDQDSGVSEAYYRYSTTRNLQLSTDGDPFAQLVLVYNNIQNGLGIFGGYNQSVFVLKK